MSEFKIHHVVTQLLHQLGVQDSPQEFVDYLQKLNCRNTSSTSSRTQVGVDHCIQTIIQNHPNPKPFLEKYEDLKLKNVDHLSEFVEILSDISVDNNLKLFMTKSPKIIKESKAAAEMTAEDLPKIKNRLLKAVQKTPIPQTTECTSKNQICIKSSTPSVISWVKKRPNMSWDFTLAQSKLSNSSEIPICSQENNMIEDLLNILVGLEGCYIESLPLTEPYGPRDFVIDESVDASIKELVKQILPLSSYYSMMQRFVEEKMQFEYGQVNNALCAAIQTLLTQYTLFICQLESEFKNGTLNLHKMWFYVQQNMHSMEIIAGITATISNAQAKGGKVLSLLHDKTLSLIGDQKAQDLCLSLTQAAAVPYMNILATWIYKGIINDPLQEFLVEDNEIIQRENVSIEDYSTDYWAKRYTVKRERIPKFLERVADIIYRTGKYLNVIHQCGKTINAKFETISYKIEEREYVEIIQNAYNFASKSLMDVLMVENDLMGRLQSVKHYFLLDKGDFILQFMNLSEKELNKNVNQVLSARLESYLEMALRMSSAYNDPYKEDMGTCLLNEDLQCQMFKILSIQTEDEQDYRNKEIHPLIGLESFTFTYKVNWPISLILNHKAIVCYQMIFRHLFYCKYVERLLCQIWRSAKLAKKYSYLSSSLYRESFALRQRMLHCVQHLEYHMMVEVIEPNWNTFKNKISKAKNLDEILIFHSDYQDKCLEECMLTNPSLLKSINEILEICCEYCRFIQVTQQHSVEAELCFAEDVVHIDCFNSISLPLDQNSLLSKFDKQKVKKKETEDEEDEGTDGGESEEILTSEEMMSYTISISQLDERFTTALMDLLSQINGMGRDSYKDRLFNLLYRLDYSFYAEKIKNMNLYLP